MNRIELNSQDKSKCLKQVKQTNEKKTQIDIQLGGAAISEIKCNVTGMEPASERTEVAKKTVFTAQFQTNSLSFSAVVTNLLNSFIKAIDLI